MMDEMPTAIDGVQGGQTETQIQIHPHAEDRWTERTPAEEPLSAAWARSVRIQAPAADADEVRLYAPYSALLVYRQGMLRTVLNNDGRISCPALGTCSSCENLIDPVVDDTCRWCDAEIETQGHGRATVTRGDVE